MTRSASPTQTTQPRAPRLPGMLGRRYHCGRLAAGRTQRGAGTCRIGLRTGVANMGQEAPDLTLISTAQKRRLLAGAVVLLAVALFGLAAKAKTSHYSPGSQSATHFSSSVKIAQTAQPLHALLAVPLIANPGLPPVVTAFLLPVALTQAVEVVSEPLAGLRPLRAPPSPAH